MSPTNLDYEELKQEVLQQIQRNQLGVLATAEGDSVTARTIMLMYDGLKIILFTPTWTRKFKQISVNKNVALAINNIQIEGVASIKGRTSDVENAGFLNAFEELYPEVYKLYRDACEEPNTTYHVIEIAPKRIALFYGPPEGHLDVINIDKKTAVRYFSSDSYAPNY
jgi:general stress protein 26